MNMVCNSLGVRREWLSAGLEPMEPGLPERDRAGPDNNRLMEDTSQAYRSCKPSADNQMMAAMVTILEEVMSGIRPKTDLDQVHALLDLIHPLTQKEES